MYNHSESVQKCYEGSCWLFRTYFSISYPIQFEKAEEYKRNLFIGVSQEKSGDSMKCEKVEDGVVPAFAIGPIKPCPPYPCGCINI